AELRRAARGGAGGRVGRAAARAADAGAVAPAFADGAGARPARARAAGPRPLRGGQDAARRLAPARLLRDARGAEGRGRARLARPPTARAEPEARAGDDRPRRLLVAPLPAGAPRAGPTLPAPRVARRPLGGIGGRRGATAVF